MVLVGKDNDSNTVQAGFFSVHIVETAFFYEVIRGYTDTLGSHLLNICTIIALLLHYITLKSELKYSSKF